MPINPRIRWQVLIRRLLAGVHAILKDGDFEQMSIELVQPAVQLEMLRLGVLQSFKKEMHGRVIKDAVNLAIERLEIEARLHLTQKRCKKLVSKMRSKKKFRGNSPADMRCLDVLVNVHVGSKMRSMSLWYAISTHPRMRIIDV